MRKALNVLVVEDDPLVRVVSVEALLDAGFEVSVATTGEEALSLCAERTADILLTDIQLPGRISGWDIAERCRDRDPQLPVIYVTGHSYTKPRPVPGGLLIPKPYHPDHLVGIVEKLSAARRGNSENL